MLNEIRLFVESIFNRKKLSYTEQLDAIRQKMEWEESRLIELQKVLVVKKKLASARRTNDQLMKTIKNVR